MNARRFSGRTSREVFDKVRRALGPDAMIVANNAVAGGVEVLALPGRVLEPVAEPAASAPGGAPDSTSGGQSAGREILDEIQRMRGLLEAGLAALSVNDLRQRNPVA